MLSDAAARACAAPATCIGRVADSLKAAYHPIAGRATSSAAGNPNEPPPCVGGHKEEDTSNDVQPIQGRSPGRVPGDGGRDRGPCRRADRSHPLDRRRARLRAPSVRTSGCGRDYMAANPDVSITVVNKQVESAARGLPDIQPCRRRARAAVDRGRPRRSVHGVRHDRRRSTTSSTSSAYLPTRSSPSGRRTDVGCADLVWQPSHALLQQGPGSRVPGQQRRA